MKHLLLLLIGCTTSQPSAPRVHVVGDVSPAIVDAANAWAPLGFVVSVEPSGQAPCGTNSWVIHDDTCEIEISVAFDPLLRARRGTNAMSDLERNLVTLDMSLTGFALAVSTAHEFGHLLLETTVHTKTGIMSGIDDAMSADDYALACTAINLCEEPPR